VKKPVVLLVLDQPQYLEIYGAYLRDRGYETLLCSSPGEGMNLLESELVSLVIVGQDTPVFEGGLVMAKSLRLRPEVPVLVVARALDTHCYLEAMDHGATDYLERPEPTDLGWVVETQLLRCAFA
jgi:DNA-binding NtrC family response regulator